MTVTSHQTAENGPRSPWWGEDDRWDPDELSDGLELDSEPLPDYELPFTDTPPPSFPNAACRGLPAEVFYGNIIQPAKDVCATCPVITECREWALDHDERFGVWGGLGPKDRRELAVI